MIHVKETPIDDQNSLIRVEGRIDNESLDYFKNLCLDHLQNKKARVTLDLKKLFYINREGKEFLKKHRHRIDFINITEFLKMEIGLESPKIPGERTTPKK